MTYVQKMKCSFLSKKTILYLKMCLKNDLYYIEFPIKIQAFFTEPLTILTSSTGRSFLSVSTSPILLTIFMPE